VVLLWLARSRAVLLLLAVEVLQAAIGLTQYHLGLPIGLVAAHLLGAALSIAAVANLRFSVRKVTA
jgi:cytochrome c oxidase assembly protein subunit 15